MTAEPSTAEVVTAACTPCKMLALPIWFQSFMRNVCKDACPAVNTDDFQEVCRMAWESVAPGEDMLHPWKSALLCPELMRYWREGQPHIRAWHERMARKQGRHLLDRPDWLMLKKSLQLELESSKCERVTPEQFQAVFLRICYEGADRLSTAVAIRTWATRIVVALFVMTIMLLLIPQTAAVLAVLPAAILGPAVAILVVLDQEATAKLKASWIMTTADENMDSTDLMAYNPRASGSVLDTARTPAARLFNAACDCVQQYCSVSTQQNLNAALQKIVSAWWYIHPRLVRLYTLLVQLFAAAKRHVYQLRVRYADQIQTVNNACYKFLLGLGFVEEDESSNPAHNTTGADVGMAKIQRTGSTVTRRLPKRWDSSSSSSSFKLSTHCGVSPADSGAFAQAARAAVQDRNPSSAMSTSELYKYGGNATAALATHGLNAFVGHRTAPGYATHRSSTSSRYSAASGSARSSTSQSFEMLYRSREPVRDSGNFSSPSHAQGGASSCFANATQDKHAQGQQLGTIHAAGLTTRRSIGQPSPLGDSARAHGFSSCSESPANYAPSSITTSSSAGHAEADNALAFQASQRVDSCSTPGGLSRQGTREMYLQSSSASQLSSHRQSLGSVFLHDIHEDEPSSGCFTTTGGQEDGSSSHAQADHGQVALGDTHHDLMTTQTDQYMAGHMTSSAAGLEQLSVETLTAEELARQQRLARAYQVQGLVSRPDVSLVEDEVQHLYMALDGTELRLLFPESDDDDSLPDCVPEQDAAGNEAHANDTDGDRVRSTSLDSEASRRASSQVAFGRAFARSLHSMDSQSQHTGQLGLDDTSSAASSLELDMPRSGIVSPASVAPSCASGYMGSDGGALSGGGALTAVDADGGTASLPSPGVATRRGGKARRPSAMDDFVGKVSDLLRLRLEHKARTQQDKQLQQHKLSKAAKKAVEKARQKAAEEGKRVLAYKQALKEELRTSGPMYQRPGVEGLFFEATLPPVGAIAHGGNDSDDDKDSGPSGLNDKIAWSLDYYGDGSAMDHSQTMIGQARQNTQQFTQEQQQQRMLLMQYQQLLQRHPDMLQHLTPQELYQFQVLQAQYGLAMDIGHDNISSQQGHTVQPAGLQGGAVGMLGTAGTAPDQTPNTMSAARSQASDAVQSGATLPSMLSSVASDISQMHQRSGHCQPSSSSSNALSSQDARSPEDDAMKTKQKHREKSQPLKKLADKMMLKLKKLTD